MYAGHKLNIHLSFLFTFSNQHCYLPDTFMESVILPQLKNKCANLKDVDNYTTIAIFNAETKILETVILQYVNDVENCDMYHIGFKKSHSTGLCTSAVKRTIDYYLKRGSYAFACFISKRQRITFAICYEPSVCRLSVCLSVCRLSVCLSVVRDVGAPYSGG